MFCRSLRTDFSVEGWSITHATIPVKSRVPAIGCRRECKSRPPHAISGPLVLALGFKTFSNAQAKALLLLALRTALLILPVRPSTGASSVSSDTRSLDTSEGLGVN